MWSSIKKIIRGATPKKVKEFFEYKTGDEYAQKSYSQEGEDILLTRIFGKKDDGFYVDVGAHHPFRFSNTKLLYDRGWQGINIEPNAETFKLFEKYRTRDINLCIGVSNQSEPLKYYRFTHPASNTFDLTLKSESEYNHEATEIIEVKPLSQILSEHLPIKVKINLLTIDTEGFDLNVLKSNDWHLHIPEWIIIEIMNFNIFEPESSEIYNFLVTKNYSLEMKLSNSCVFKYKYQEPVTR